MDCVCVCVCVCTSVFLHILLLVLMVSAGLEANSESLTCLLLTFSVINYLVFMDDYRIKIFG